MTADRIKEIVGGAAFALFMGFLVVACPDVERRQIDGRCMEATTYAQIYTTVGPCK